MKIRHLSLVLISLCALGGPAWAQAGKKDAKKDEKKAPAPKSAADQSLDAFNKVLRESGAKDQARFQKVINAGSAYVMQNPTHWGVNGAVNNLAFYAGSIDKKQAAARTSYLSFLKLEVANGKYKEGVTDAAKAALAAVEAGIADFEVREAINRDNMVAFREKIDALAETPGSGRFLADRERSYLHLTAISSPQRAEEMAKKLLEHKEKGVKDMAREELNILEVKKEPFAAKFTALDGKAVDLAQLRGKVVAVYYWSATNKGSTDKLGQLRQYHSDNKKKGLEVVTVSLDKADDREKLAKYIKDTKLTLPVYFDGKGSKNEFAPKLTGAGTSKVIVFDQKGTLFTTVSGSPVGRLTPYLETGQLDSVFKAMTAPPKK